MQECYYVHPDNVGQVRRELAVRVAVIARPDEFMEAKRCKQIIVETERGVHTRCFLASSDGIPFIIVYGRFGRIRTTAANIDFELTQEALSFLGITHLVGTFVVGSVREGDTAGTVYVPHDLVGLSGYNQARTRHRPTGFRTVDMLKPFCDGMRTALLEAAEELSFEVRPRGVYACFHGWPRIETQAELDRYAAMNCDVVGQTLDPECTLAREAGCCYAAVAVTIDDAEVRSRFMQDDPIAAADIDRHLVEGRQKTFGLFLAALPRIADLPPCDFQAKLKSGINEHFYYRPKHLIDPE